MLSRIMKKRHLLLGSAIGVLYFSQICSFAHSHLTMFEHRLMDENHQRHDSAHSDQSSSHHDDSHHRCTIDQHSSHWYRASYKISAPTASFSQLASILIELDVDDDRPVSRSYHELPAPPAPLFLPLSSLPRSPPVSA